MTINGLLACSAKELALPHVITDEPVVDLSYHPALADVSSISLNHMRAQVMLIVDPNRVGIGISIYGDKEVADEVKISSRGGHAALGDLNRSWGAYGETCEILLVIAVPPRMLLDTYDFAGNIGLGGVPAEVFQITIGEAAQFYAECVGQLRGQIRDSSTITVDTVTSELVLNLYREAKFSAQRTYGAIDLSIDGEAQATIRNGIISSAEFISTGSGMLQYGGVVAGNAKLEQHGSGQMSLYEVRTSCVPKITGSGTVSFNGEIFRN